MIEKEKLIELLSEYHSGNYDEAQKIADYLFANGVTIPVRCKECKHWKQTVGQGIFSFELPEGECRNDRYLTPWQESRPITPEDHYCADGERRADNGT